LVVGRELTDVDDWQLLAFERMRLIDMAHYWAENTHKTYQSKLGIIWHFEGRYGVQVLRQTPLDHPPNGMDVPLLWCQEAYGLRKSHTKRFEGTDARLAFSTVHQLRSAASHFLTWDMMVSHPQEAFLDQQCRVIRQPCRATDCLSFSLHTGGLRARVGNQTQPSVALLDVHVRTLDQELNRAYRRSPSARERRHLALGGLTNLFLWLGWLRSLESFDLTWADILVVEPHDSASLDLPGGCGMVSCRLAAETKSAQSHHPNVPMAFKTMSGLHLGKWFHRARQTSALGPNWSHSTKLIFSQPDGKQWSPLFFRKRFLYPSLHQQRAAGDPYLRPFDGSPGNSLEAKLWSLHCYRRGARSHVSRGGKFGRHRLRRATKDEVYEHGRWRRQRSGEAIDKMYQSWPLRDRIKLTLLCH
jgi:hypothetical protein